MPIMKFPTHRILFFIDCLGALFSAIAYSFVLVDYRDTFGFSREILIVLSCFGFIYATYSGICFFINPRIWQPYLAIIAIANLLHCCMSAYFINSFYDEMKQLGLIYFVVEIVLIAVLATIELKVAFRNRKVNLDKVAPRKID